MRAAKSIAAHLKTPFRTTVFCFVFVIALAWNAAANFVQNGNFTSVSYSGTLALTTLYGQFGTGTGSTLTVANWATSGYNFVYAPGTVDVGTSGSGANTGKPNEAPGQYNAPNGYGNTYMWGPNNGSANGFPSTDPAGGNFIAADGVYEQGAITQTINGLTVGKVYQLKFYWGGAQQQSFTGPTTEWWQVTLGANTYTTGTVSLVTEGFSGWAQQSYFFTASASSETLSFLAGGTPSGEPPFSLLGGVDIEGVPESSNWMVFAGFGTVCIVFESVRRRRRPNKSGAESLAPVD